MSDQAKIKFNCESCGKAYRVPAQLAGRGAKCKGCGAKMRVPKPVAAEDDEVFSMDELEAMGDGDEPSQTVPRDEVFSLDDLAALDSAAAPADAGHSPVGDPIAGTRTGPNAESTADAGMLAAQPFGFQAPTGAAKPGKPAKRRSSKQNPIQSISGMWQAFTTAPDTAGKSLPKVRHVSMGGVFLVIGAIQLLISSIFRAPPNQVAAAEVTLGGAAEDVLFRLTGLGVVVTAVLLFLAGGLMIGRRILLPRAEPESPLVLTVFYAMVGLLVAGSLFVLVGGGESAKGVAQLGGLGIGLAVAAFGVWMLCRLSMDYDNSAVWLILLPAILLPGWILIAALARIEGEGFPWAIFVLAIFGLMIVMVLMGGAISFFVLLILPILLLFFGGLGMFGGWVGLSDMLIGMMFVGCYVLLILTRWKVIFKPVAWQFVLLIIGSGLMLTFMNYHADTKLIVDAREARNQSDVKLTQALVEDQAIGEGVFASRNPYPNTREIPEGTDKSKLLYLSTGSYITDPVIRRAEREEQERERERYHDRIRNPVETPPQRIFAGFELAPGADDLPGVGADWADYQPPDLEIKPNQTVECWGYRIKLLPGYRVGYLGSKDGHRTLRIVGPQNENPSIALEMKFVSHGLSDDGRVVVPAWSTLLRSEDLDEEEDFIDYGQIASMHFARGAPSDKQRDRYRERIVYVARTADTRRRVVMHIPLYQRPDQDVLASEWMARSIERDPVKMGDPVPSKDARIDSSLVQYDTNTIRANRWRTAGVFASIDMSGRASDAKTGSMSVTYSVGSEGASIRLSLTPITPGQSPTYRVQAQGPEAAPSANDPFTGRTIYAYGGYVNYDRLWDDEVFVRVENGVRSVAYNKQTQSVTYYGRLGGYWLTASLFRDPDKPMPMRELEDALRRIRLASALEIADDYSALRNWVPSLLGAGSADLPLAGGTTVGESFELDLAGKARLSANVDPDTGQFVAIYPEIDPKELEAYKTWGPHEELEKYLGDQETYGPISIRPIAELKKSARSNDRRVEWFANTDAGRVSITMRIDPLGDDEPVALPARKDPDTGQTLIQVGKRTLTEDGEVLVSYRESRGLRVWRVVMPQVGGASLRRCYYLAEMPGRRLTISADFERDQAVQLQAIDTAMSTLIYRPPAKIE